jgi:hypothetical protein
MFPSYQNQPASVRVAHLRHTTTQQKKTFHVCHIKVGKQMSGSNCLSHIFVRFIFPCLMLDLSSQVIPLYQLHARVWALIPVIMILSLPGVNGFSIFYGQYRHFPVDTHHQSVASMGQQML